MEWSDVNASRFKLVSATAGAASTSEITTGESIVETVVPHVGGRTADHHVAVDHSADGRKALGRESS